MFINSDKILILQIVDDFHIRMSKSLMPYWVASCLESCWVQSHLLIWCQAIETFFPILMAITLLVFLFFITNPCSINSREYGVSVVNWFTEIRFFFIWETTRTLSNLSAFFSVCKTMSLTWKIFNFWPLLP